MEFLRLQNPTSIKLARTVLVDLGFVAERLASDAARAATAHSMKNPTPTTGFPTKKRELFMLVNRKLPKPRAHNTLRHMLDITDSTTVPVIRNPKTTSEDAEAVFYFPGCGNDRPVPGNRSCLPQPALERRCPDRASAAVHVLRLSDARETACRLKTAAS